MSEMSILQFATIFGFAIFVIATFCLAFFNKPKHKTHRPHAFGSAEIKFSEKENRFVIRGRRFIPVSVAVNLFFNAFDKDLYAARKSEETGMSKDKIIEEWDLHRERARATGIFLHKEVAAFFTGSNMKGSFRFTFNGKYYQADEIINIEKEESLFRQFISQNPLQVYRTNFLVADSTWRLAGRVAFIGKCSDGYVLYDWKRRNGITDKYGNAITENAFDQKGTNGLENIWDTPFWHYALQLNLYRAILEKNHHLKICNIYLIDISPQRDNFAKIPIPLLDNELKAALEFLAGKDNSAFPSL